MTRRSIAHRLVNAGGEAAVVLSLYLMYSAARVFVQGGETSAVEHSFALVSFERTIGLFHEVSLQRLVDRAPWFADTMNWYYQWAYLPILIGSAAIMYARDRALYRRYRNALFASAAIGVLIFAMLPVAPPRMLPEYGFVDAIGKNVTRSALRNEFAAVPSFHVGFTLLAGMGVAHAFRFRPWALAFGVLAPTLMLVSVVATGNHFFIDVIAGCAVVGSMWTVWVRWLPSRAPALLLRPAASPSR
jgi:hypothetical protein